MLNFHKAGILLYTLFGIFPPIVSIEVNVLLPFLVGEDGISDYNVVDKIRGARATTINSTQSPTSYIPPMGSTEKADFFLLNLGSKIYFTAADRQASEIVRHERQPDVNGPWRLPEYSEAMLFCGLAKVSDYEATMS